MLNIFINIANFLMIITSIFLICLVLIQRGKGGGLAGAFGGAGSVAEHACTFVFAASRMRASGSGSAGDNCATAGSMPARKNAASKYGLNRTELMQFLHDK